MSLLWGTDVFNECNKLESVTYHGINEICKSGKSFGSCPALKSICVPIDYNSSMLCNYSVQFDSSSYDEQFRKQHNKCFEVLVCFENGTSDASVTQRSEAREWEEKRSNVCTDYVCDNESGNKLMNKCNRSNNEICENNACISLDDDGKGDDVWMIEVVIAEGVSVIEFDIRDIAEVISEVSGVGVEAMEIGIEADDDGYITRVIITVSDKDDADVLTKTLSECSSEGRSDYDSSNECEGILRYVKHVQPRDTISEGNLLDAAAVSLLLFPSLLYTLCMYDS